MTKEESVRLMAKALAEVCLHAHVTDCWILHNVDPEIIEEDELIEGLPFQTQPWYELSKVLPVSEEALVAIISGGPPPRDWDKDVSALVEYIVAAVMGMGRTETIFDKLDIGKPIS